MPKITGTVLWKTIAPVMLPRARVSFPSRTHRTELIFSGSSVARGASMRATSPAGRPMVSAVCLTASTKTSAPATMSTRASSAWATTAHVGGDGLLVDYHVLPWRLAPGELLAHARCTATDLHPLLPALAVGYRGAPCDEHRQRRQQERRAEDR